MTFKYIYVLTKKPESVSQYENSNLPRTVDFKDRMTSQRQENWADLKLGNLTVNLLG